MSCSTTLKSRGYRLTPQRRLILDILHDSGGHLTADDIFGQVQTRISGVNKSTVYRTLELLESLGLVVKSEFGSSHIYHHAEEGHHHHLACRRCGRIMNCDKDLLLPLKDSLLKRYGFSAELSHHIIQGLCRDCRGQD